MKILIAAATRQEVKPLEEYLLLKDAQSALRAHAIELMITGPGSVFTAFYLGKMLPIDNWDLVINAGICGSFSKQFAIGTTVNVISDTFGDFGANDDEHFLDIFETGLLDPNTFPFEEKWIRNPTAFNYPSLKLLPAVKAVTVNTVSGNTHQINKLLEKFPASVESMEGAAFMYCCRKESIPFLQIRTVSNFVAKRDKRTWNIPIAIQNLNETMIRLLQEMIA